MASAKKAVNAKLEAERVMLDPHCNRRGTVRTLLILPVSLGLGLTDHVGIIRDISPTGMFFYSDFTPPVGAEIELQVRPPQPSYPQRLTYRGIVVRLTTGVRGAAMGIGLSLTGTRPATALQSLGAALSLRHAGSRMPSRQLH